MDSKQGSEKMVCNPTEEKSQCVFQIGDKVKMVNCLEAECHEDEVWTVDSMPWEVCGTTVIKLRGRAGGFDITKLEKI